MLQPIGSRQPPSLVCEEDWSMLPSIEVCDREPGSQACVNRERGNVDEAQWPFAATEVELIFAEYRSERLCCHQARSVTEPDVIAHLIIYLRLEIPAGPKAHERFPRRVCLGTIGVLADLGVYALEIEGVLLPECLDHGPEGVGNDRTSEIDKGADVLDIGRGGVCVHRPDQPAREIVVFNRVWAD